MAPGTAETRRKTWPSSILPSISPLLLDPMSRNGHRGASTSRRAPTSLENLCASRPKGLPPDQPLWGLRQTAMVKPNLNRGEHIEDSPLRYRVNLRLRRMNTISLWLTMADRIQAGAKKDGVLTSIDLKTPLTNVLIRNGDQLNRD